LGFWPDIRGAPWSEGVDCCADSGNKHKIVPRAREENRDTRDFIASLDAIDFEIVDYH
jgi:hypothetical protein